MKILWAKADFLHPTTKGGQIRTLETLRRLHREHEIHYVGFSNPQEPEGVARSNEYAARVYPVELRVPDRSSPRFAVQLARGLVSPVPVSIERYRSSRMRHTIAQLEADTNFDVRVCDFLTPSINIGAMSRYVLFQHNVETCIWQRHAAQPGNPARRRYMALQAARMEAYERRICREAARVIAVSEADAATMRQMFEIDARPIPTGVDVEYFAPQSAAAADNDLVFVGSMDWMPNIDGVRWFVTQVLPLIRRTHPQTSVTIVGRKPGADIAALAEANRVRVTGTVADVRPFLWNSRISIVPLHIGGGTRLKIYEAMAAGIAVVSTTVGAEGLDIDPPRNIRIADDPAGFAAACTHLLSHDAERAAVAAAGRDLAHEHGWDQVTKTFAAALVGG